MPCDRLPEVFEEWGPRTPDARPAWVVTHPAPHHADEVFGVAVLHLLEPGGVAVIRSWDGDEQRRHADHSRVRLVDVGKRLSVADGWSDHHQETEGVECRGHRCASAGLVWATHGAAQVRQLMQARGSQSIPGGSRAWSMPCSRA